MGGREIGTWRRAGDVADRVFAASVVMRRGRGPGRAALARVVEDTLVDRAFYSCGGARQTAPSFSAGVVMGCRVAWQCVSSQ